MAEKGWVSARKLEVTGNGSAKGSTGHGIHAGVGGDDRIAADISNGAKISQNAGHGVFSQSGVRLDGTTVAVSDNGEYGIYAYNDVRINNSMSVSAGSVVNISNNKSGWGIYSQSGDISIGSESRTSAAVNSNSLGGIRAGTGSVTARILEVTGNQGVGIKTPSNLDIMVSGKICDNTGGDLLVGGIATLTNVTRCDSDNDGSGDSVESGDVNKDGIPDKLQNHVAVFEDVAFGADGTMVQISNAYSEYETEGGAKYGFDLDPKTSGSRDNSKRDFTPGSTTIVTIWLPEGVNPVSYFGYGPTADNATPHWYDFLYDGATGAEIADGKIILHLKDGARGDNDLTADGEIVHEGHHQISGDFTGDGATGLDDVIAILKLLAGIEVSVFNADLSGDGKIGLADAVIMLQKIAGL